MFSMCSELTPRARIPDTRIPQLMQPCFRIVFKYVVDGGDIAVVEARGSSECDTASDMDNIGEGEDDHENERDDDDDDAKREW